MTASDVSRPPQGWTSRSGFILATIGSAIGVGSIWKFPYEVGANGGGAFVLVYLVGLALVVVPLMLAEFAIGHRGHADAATSLEVVAKEESASTRWGLFGLLGAITAFLILSFYAVVGGWTLAYAYLTLVDGLPAGASDAAADFGDLLASPGRMMLFQGAFLGLVAAVVIRGVQNGIESAMKILMPLMALLLTALAIYSMRNGDASAALRFLFVPEFDDLTGRGVLDALGLGFFSIGVGLGILLTYAAYSPPGADLRTVAVASVAADTVISFVAGLAVFPIVFANGLDAGSGPGLVFETLPVAFGSMPAGRLVAAGVLHPAGHGRPRLGNLHAGGDGGRARPPPGLVASDLGRGCRLRLLRGRSGHGAVVQPVERIPPLRMDGAVRAGDGLRPAGRRHVAAHAAGRGAGHRRVHGMGDLRPAPGPRAPPARATARWAPVDAAGGGPRHHRRRRRRLAPRLRSVVVRCSGDG